MKGFRTSCSFSYPELSLSQELVSLQDRSGARRRRASGARRADERGKLLLLRRAQLALAHGSGRMEWWALEWNRGAIDFYRSLGAMPMSDWAVYRLSGAALQRLAADGARRGQST